VVEEHGQDGVRSLGLRFLDLPHRVKGDWRVARVSPLRDSAPGTATRNRESGHSGRDDRYVYVWWQDAGPEAGFSFFFTPRIRRSSAPGLRGLGRDGVVPFEGFLDLAG
jgi:hypothetical protein